MLSYKISHNRQRRLKRRKAEERAGRGDEGGAGAAAVIAQRITPARIRLCVCVSSLDCTSSITSMTATIGVLALQGSFNEHIAELRRLGVKGVEMRKPEHLDNLSSLIIPGGESNTMAKLAEYHNFFPALRDFVKTGKPVWGTCAGLIFLANKAIGQKSGGQELIGGLDCTVHRNFFGSQLENFEEDLSVPELAANEGGPPSFRGVFTRAPAILEAGPDVEILAYYSVPQSESTSTEATVHEAQLLLKNGEVDK